MAYMCHRKVLSPTHSFRGKKTWFDGKTEHGRKGRILTGQNISQILKNYHVLMQQLLPVALRGLLPKGPRIVILRLCAFFHHLCERVIDREQLLVMETKIAETLCMFERFFPPSFFDIMVHLTVHLGREARLCGVVHFRWMYPFERYNSTSYNS